MNIQMSPYGVAAVGLLASVFVATACETAQDEERRTSAALKEADQKIAVARREADEAVVRANKRAEENIAAAHEAFMKLREDYRHETAINLVEVDRDVERLESKAKELRGTARTEFDARLVRVRAARDAFMKHYATLDALSSAQWDSTRAELDKELSALKSMIAKG